MTETSAATSGSAQTGSAAVSSPPPLPTVLLIEDNPADARLMRETLAELSTVPFSMHWVDRLSSGVAYLDVNPVQLVLLDLSLPDADGLRGLHAIRTAYPDVPVVVLTGLIDEAAADRALREGAQDYLFKGYVSGDAVARSVRYAIERNRAEQALREREEQLKQLQLVSDIALAHAGLDNLLERLLSQIQEALGADTAAILLADDEQGDLVRQVARGLGDNITERVPIGEGFAGTVAAERRVVRIDDLTQPDAQFCSPLLRDSGVVSVLGAPLQVRDRLVGVIHVGMLRPFHFGDEQVRLLDLVADRVALAIENLRLYRELQQAVDMRDHLLAVTAHDLRNPLGSINLLAESSLIEAESQQTISPQRLLTQMQRIGQATTTMGRLIDDLMDAAHLQLGRALQLNPSRADLVEIVALACRDFTASPDDRYSLRFERQVKSISGLWDQPRLGRVVMNLLDNARKYSPKGGEICVRVAKQWVADESWAVLSVEDHGIGIPPADVSRVFDRFHRAGNVVGRFPGTGIGLAGARQIVEQHGGSIQVSSSEDTGSIFTVRLPLAAEGH